MLQLDYRVHAQVHAPVDKNLFLSNSNILGFEWNWERMIIIFGIFTGVARVTNTRWKCYNSVFTPDQLMNSI